MINVDFGKVDCQYFQILPIHPEILVFFFLWGGMSKSREHLDFHGSSTLMGVAVLWDCPVDRNASPRI